MKKNIVLLMALFALLMGTPSNADAQTIIPKSRFSARNVVPQVKEHNVLALFCMRYFVYDIKFYPTGTPLYYQTGNSRSIIKINGYKKVSRFGETTKGDLAWSRECSYENGRLKNIRYPESNRDYNISAGDVDIYEYDADGRIVRATRYNSEGEQKVQMKFSVYSKSFYFNSRELEIKDDGYYFYYDDYRGYYYNDAEGLNWSYCDKVAYRNKYTVNMQSGYVERVCYWRYKKLTIKGRLAGKKYNWHYSNSAMIRFDPECCFFPDNDYIVEYEEVL